MLLARSEQEPHHPRLQPAVAARPAGNVVAASRDRLNRPCMAAQDVLGTARAPVDPDAAPADARVLTPEIDRGHRARSPGWSAPGARRCRPTAAGSPTSPTGPGLPRLEVAHLTAAGDRRRRGPGTVSPADQEVVSVAWSPDGAVAGLSGVSERADPGRAARHASRRHRRPGAGRNRRPGNGSRRLLDGTAAHLRLLAGRRARSGRRRLPGRRRYRRGAARSPPADSSP